MKLFNNVLFCYQDLRRTVRKGDPEELKVFLKTISSEDIINIRDDEGKILKSISSEDVINNRDEKGTILKQYPLRILLILEMNKVRS